MTMAPALRGRPARSGRIKKTRLDRSQAAEAGRKQTASWRRGSRGPRGWVKGAREGRAPGAGNQAGRSCASAKILGGAGMTGDSHNGSD